MTVPSAPDSRYTPVVCLHHLFEEQAARTPDAAALLFEQERLTYAWIDRAATWWSRRLREAGAGPEVLVGLCMDRSPQMIVGLLAILKAGAAYVPLDPTFPSERLAFILADTRAPLLLTQPHFCECLPDYAGRIVTLPDLSALKATQREATGSEEAAPDEGRSLVTTSEALCCVLYTSGSTGEPKGVLVTHRGAVNSTAWTDVVFPATADGVECYQASTSFIAGLSGLFRPLRAGRPLVLVPEQDRKDPQRLVQIVQEYEITHIVFSPSLLRSVIEAYPDAGHRLRSLRYCIVGSEPFPADLCQQAMEALPGTRFVNIYGMTEASGPATLWSIQALSSCDPTAIGPTVPIGRQIRCAHAYALGTDFRPVAVGVSGELCIGGVGVTRGYLNRPDLTAERFVPDPFSEDPGARMYCTGDFVQLRSDGALEAIGRADHQIKIRGIRIQLYEVETALARHPQVRAAVVTLREDTPGDPRLVGYIVPAERAPTRVELRRFLEQILPDPMVPTLFVTLDQLPLNSNGKVDRKALPAPQAEVRSGQEFVAPCTSLEKEIAGIWCEVLALPQVGVHDDFFELGGHSLQAAHLLTRIQNALGMFLPLQTFLQSATVASLARTLSSAFQTSYWTTLSTIVPVQTSSGRLPFFCIASPEVNPLGYVEMGRHLRDQPLYLLQTQYRPRKGQPCAREELRDLATVHIRAMRDQFPEGPYCLGGMCEGAHIAFEMARQLQEAGMRVPLLVSFDAWPEENTRTRFGWWLSGVYLTIESYHNDRSVGLVQTGRRMAGYTVHVLWEWLLRPFRSPSPESWEARYWPGRDFVPPRFQGCMTVLRVRKQDLYRVRSRDLGWSAWASEGTDVVDIPGEHTTLFRDPHVKEVAAILQRQMDRIQPRA